jgi:hypothetical protein
VNETPKTPGFRAAQGLSRPTQRYNTRPGSVALQRRGGRVQLQDEALPKSDSLTPIAGSSIAVQPCPTCGGGLADRNGYSAAGFVYAIGRVEAHFPSLGIEKELMQAGGRTGAGGTDATFMRQALESNRYIARQVCWVLRISGMETYLLRPRDPTDFGLLVEALREAPAPTDMDVVIGVLGPEPATCGVLTLPVVIFDQMYSFDRASLMDALPRPGGEPGKKRNGEEEAAFIRSSTEMLDRIALMTDNAGATDEHRALNYLAVRYDSIYEHTSRNNMENRRLSRIDVQPAPVNSTRNLVDVIFTYSDRATDVPDRWFVRVDVDEEFPFLVSQLAPYFSR